jgi:hypothetical protein
MESLFEKTALVVQKTESLDPEDDSIGYEVTFIVDAKNMEPGHHHTSFVMETDDKSLFEKFAVGKETDLKFMEGATKIQQIKKAN